ncbi:hypothetical protein QE152_g19571 [Popillia japonica]|uniref:Uncharacterized protein n=1 Tax=Popillia japonica TaxID=7064 RepID=A0AAW1KNT0_POPJA
MQKWMRINPSIPVSMYNVTPAYGRAATTENAASGFKTTDNFKSPLGNSSLGVSVEAIFPIPNPANSERTSKKRKRKDTQQACEITSIKNINNPYKEEPAGKQKVKEAKPKSIFGKKKLKNDDNNNTKNCRSFKPSTSLCPDHEEADVGSTSSWYCLLCKVGKQIDSVSKMQ